jgi:hypothetical protein
MKVKRSLQIYRNDLVPKIRSGLHKGLGGIPARIVDQDVNTPEPRNSVLDVPTCAVLGIDIQRLGWIVNVSIASAKRPVMTICCIQ